MFACLEANASSLCSLYVLFQIFIFYLLTHFLYSFKTFFIVSY